MVNHESIRGGGAGRKAMMHLSKLPKSNPTNLVITWCNWHNFGSWMLIFYFKTDNYIWCFTQEIRNTIALIVTWSPNLLAGWSLVNTGFWNGTHTYGLKYVKKVNPNQEDCFVLILMILVQVHLWNIPVIIVGQQGVLNVQRLYALLPYQLTPYRLHNTVAYVYGYRDSYGHNISWFTGNVTHVYTQSGTLGCPIG